MPVKMETGWNGMRLAIKWHQKCQLWTIAARQANLARFSPRSVNLALRPPASSSSAPDPRLGRRLTSWSFGQL